MRNLSCPVLASAALAIVSAGCGTQAVLVPMGLAGPSVEPVDVEVRSTDAAPLAGKSKAAGPKAGDLELGDEEAKAFLGGLRPNPMGGSADGLVRSREWRSQEWGDPAAVAAWRRSRSLDDVVLLAKLGTGRHDKSAISRPARLSLSGRGTVRVEVFNSSDVDMPVAFAVYASADRVYSESAAQVARPGWNYLVYDISARTFKSATSKWEHTAELWGGDDVREFVLLFYGDGGAVVAVDSVGVDVREEPAKVTEEAASD